MSRIIILDIPSRIPDQIMAMALIEKKIDPTQANIEALRRELVAASERAIEDFTPPNYAEIP